jgi:hypothetical protein
MQGQHASKTGAAGKTGTILMGTILMGLGHKGEHVIMTLDFDEPIGRLDFHFHFQFSLRTLSALVLSCLVLYCLVLPLSLSCIVLFCGVLSSFLPLPSRTKDKDDKDKDKDGREKD